MRFMFAAMLMATLFISGCSGSTMFGKTWHWPWESAPRKAAVNTKAADEAALEQQREVSNRIMQEASGGTLDGDTLGQ